MPDAELLAHAAAGDLHKPDVLTAQTRRHAARRPQVRGLATEFAGNWLDFRRFEEHNASIASASRASPTSCGRRCSRSRSATSWTSPSESLGARSALRQRHVRESGRWPSTTACRTPRGRADDWAPRRRRARRYGRGGLLPMAVFLTKNAPGLRTSPVKRGYWVVRRVLGEADSRRRRRPFPSCPGRGEPGRLTLPQTLARHRDDKSCAGCHAFRFDRPGLRGLRPDRRTARRRTSAAVRSRTARDLPRRQRPHRPRRPARALPAREPAGAILSTTCAASCFSYALGRSLRSRTNAPRRDAQQAGGGGHAFGTLVQRIVVSRQFLMKRTTPRS